MQVKLRAGIYLVPLIVQDSDLMLDFEPVARNFQNCQSQLGVGVPIGLAAFVNFTSTSATFETMLEQWLRWATSGTGSSTAG